MKFKLPKNIRGHSCILKQIPVQANKIIFFFLIAGLIGKLHAQPLIEKIKIPLPCEMNHSNNEYNGMVKRNGKLLFISQFPVRNIYVLDTMEIVRYLTKETNTISPDDSDTVEIRNVNDVTRKIAGYEGIESAVAVGNELFFTVETDARNNTCYVIKGTFDESKPKRKKIILDTTSRLSLPEPRIIDNAGFEAMTYLPGSEKFIAFFEYNDVKISRPKALVFDASLKQISDTFTFEKHLPMRLTDVYAINDTTLIGINYNYPGKSDQQFREEGESVKNGKGADVPLAEMNYSRLVKLKIKNKIISVELSADIECCKECSAGNFETIIPFYKGYLILTDEYPRPETELIYIKAEF